MLKKLASILVFIILFALFFLVSGKLFFPEQTQKALNLIKKVDQNTEETLTVGLSSDVTSFNPATSGASNKEVLLNIYEGLVSIDRDLQIEPALAVSLGSVDDFTWEFRLRPGVRFHDGSALTMTDVEGSIQFAQEDSQSEIRDLLSNIEDFTVRSDDVFRITTGTPDPLFLQKLANVLIFPQSQIGTIATNPVGTGPYSFVEIDGDTMILARHGSYWGISPDFEKIKFILLSSRDDRITMLRQKGVSIMVDVPPEFARDLDRGSEKIDYVFDHYPTLESTFLLFGFDGILKEKKLREAIRLLIDRNEVNRLGYGFARPATQFVSPGIQGFHPGLKIPDLDLEKASSLIKEVSPLDRLSVTLDLPVGFDALGTFVQESLESAGIDVVLNFLSQPELESKISSGESDFYFFGWRSELGDASGLLTSVAHSPRGAFGEYSTGMGNATVDTLVEGITTETDQAIRLADMRRVMEILVDEEIIGVPLVIPEVLYAISPDLVWTPRVDGYVLGEEVRKAD
ncbi:MAG: ABC transporter substrate-binding protein [Patescibacteria group bacterium]